MIWSATHGNWGGQRKKKTIKKESADVIPEIRMLHILLWKEGAA
jgi:hypothetical protein